MTNAVRTIVVTTRAAVNSHRVVNNPEQARASAARGVELLDQLAAEAGLRGVGFESAELIQEARTELASLAGSALTPMGPGIGEESPRPPRTGPRSRGAPPEAH